MNTTHTTSTKITLFIFYISLFTLISSISIFFYDLLQDTGTGLCLGWSIKSLIQYSFVLLAVVSLYLAFFKKISWVQNAIISITTIVLMVAGIEAVCGYLLNKDAKNWFVIDGPTHKMANDTMLGYKSIPNSKQHVYKKVNEQLIYQVSYETDSLGFRVVPNQQKNAQSYALFLGCSVTFGEGVNSAETSAAYFQEYNKGTNAYNLAYGGYGPQHALATIQKYKLTNFVKEKTGHAFFVYIPDHVNRAINAYSYYVYNKGRTPYYKLQGDSVAYKGLFSEKSKFQQWMYSVIGASNLLTKFGIGYPLQLTQKHYEITAAILEKTAFEYKQQFKNDNFYVVIYPTQQDNSLIINLLKQKGIKILDYSNLFAKVKEPMGLPMDNHPTPLANQLLARQLTKDLSQ